MIGMDLIVFCFIIIIIIILYCIILVLDNKTWSSVLLLYILNSSSSSSSLSSSSNSSVRRHNLLWSDMFPSYSSASLIKSEKNNYNSIKLESVFKYPPTHPPFEIELTELIESVAKKGFVFRSLIYFLHFNYSLQVSTSSVRNFKYLYPDTKRNRSKYFFLYLPEEEEERDDDDPRDYYLWSLFCFRKSISFKLKNSMLLRYEIDTRIKYEEDESIKKILNHSLEKSNNSYLMNSASSLDIVLLRNALDAFYPAFSSIIDVVFVF
jgi:hypothetical protein